MCRFAQGRHFGRLSNIFLFVIRMTLLDGWSINQPATTFIFIFPAMSSSYAAAPSPASGGIVALLDLPPETSISVDGSTQIIRREDFVGIHGFPPSGFHFVVVSSAGGSSSSGSRSITPGTSGDNDADDGGNGSSQSSMSKPSALHTTGFVLMRRNNSSGDDADNVSGHNDDGWIVVRRYDPQTEEISRTPPDDITCSNLQRSILDGSIGTQRAVPYDRFIENQSNPETWKVITTFITTSLLSRRGIASGEKIVPGAYEEDFTDEKGPTKASAEREPSDGISICYPPMPCIEGAHMARIGGHAGTKRYLSHLSPSDRTALFLDVEPGSKILDTVLRAHYDGSWEELVGDVQLSFLLFLHLGCLSSFEHWRDTVSMLSLVGSGAVLRHTKLYCNILSTISCHLSSIERDFFEEVEYSGGNFFLPALNRFVKLCSKCSDHSQELLDSARELRQIVQSRFGIQLVPIISSQGADLRSDDDDNDEAVMEIDMANGSAIDISTLSTQTVKQDKPDVRIPYFDSDGDDDEEDDDDGPVVVAEADVEASLERSAATTQASAQVGHSISVEEDSSNRKKFPLIFAAMSPQEDILMCCARILDPQERNDVTLIREAAAYLEAVESKR